MQNEEDKISSSKLPVTLKSVDFDYEKPKRRNELIDPRKYDNIDSKIGEQVKIGTNGVTYMSE